ncbi:MAG TPA: hypothetical protein VFN26_04360 [Candidatus Acidoferrum sp.]|nr:hypothetical protein [Candidatus Acidoferrum sp.]
MEHLIVNILRYVDDHFPGWSNDHPNLPCCSASTANRASAHGPYASLNN